MNSLTTASIALIITGLYYSFCTLPSIPSRQQSLKDRIREIIGFTDFEIIPSQGEAYTLNKRLIHMDLSEQYTDDELLRVLIHEVSHCLCSDVGHTDEFHNIEESILKRAMNMKLLHNYNIPKSYPCHPY